MFAEEEFLREKFGKDYEQWALQTPAILPDFFQWNSPPLPFSFRFVLAREYMSFYSVALSFTIIGILYGKIHDFEISYIYNWLIFIGISTLMYSLLTVLRKKTRILKVLGR